MPNFWIDVLFIVGEGMVDDPQMSKSQGPFEWWQDKPELRDQLLNIQDVYTPDFLKK